jgi:hypothetical protein
MYASRTVKINIKNLKGVYTYQRYTVDSSCAINCEFTAVEQKEVTATEPYQEMITANPYSVNLIVLKKKPEEIKAALPADTATPQPGGAQEPSVKQAQQAVTPATSLQEPVSATTKPKE